MSYSFQGNLAVTGNYRIWCLRPCGNYVFSILPSFAGITFAVFRQYFVSFIIWGNYICRCSIPATLCSANLENAALIRHLYNWVFSELHILIQWFQIFIAECSMSFLIYFPMQYIYFALFSFLLRQKIASSEKALC